MTNSKEPRTRAFDMFLPTERQIMKREPIFPQVAILSAECCAGVLLPHLTT